MPEIFESDHSRDTIGEFEEPAGGWVGSPQLKDTELVVTVLCRFTGLSMSNNAECPDRVARLHPDTYCRASYIQVDALRSGRVKLEGFGEWLPEEIRVPLTGGEPSGASHE